VESGRVRNAFYPPVRSKRTNGTRTRRQKNPLKASPANPTAIRTKPETCPKSRNRKPKRAAPKLTTHKPTVNAAAAAAKTQVASEEGMRTV
jgi:hypothetical protein